MFAERRFGTNFSMQIAVAGEKIHSELVDQHSGRVGGGLYRARRALSKAARPVRGVAGAWDPERTVAADPVASGFASRRAHIGLVPPGHQRTAALLCWL